MLIDAYGDSTARPADGEGRLPTGEAEVARHRHCLAGELRSGPAGESAQEEGPLVLVVDDDDNTRMLLCGLLEMRGYRVALAGDGYEAVRVARELRPRVVLMDLVLPRSDGIECTSELREHPATAEIPVVAMTGSWLGGQPEVLASAGFAGAIRKPCSGSALLSELERVLARTGCASRPSLRQA